MPSIAEQTRSMDWDSTVTAAQRKRESDRRPEYLQGRAEKISGIIPFLEQNKLAPGRVRNLRSEFARINELLTAQGLDSYTIPENLTAEQYEQELIRFASRGPRQSSKVARMRELGAERQSEEGRAAAKSRLEDTRADYLADPRREMMWRWLQTQVNDPEPFKERFDLLEGDIRGMRADALRSHEQSFRHRLAGRGLPGQPYLSGPGLTEMGGYRGEVDRGTMDALRSSRISEILATEDWEKQMQAMSSGFVEGEYGRTMGLDQAMAAIEGQNPFVISAGGFDSYAALLASLSAMDQAGDTSFMDEYGALLASINQGGGQFAGQMMGGKTGGGGTKTTPETNQPPDY